MNQKAFIRTQLVGMAIFIPVLAYTIYFLDPRKGAIAITVFLVATFAAVMCTFSLLGFLLRQKISNNENLNENVRTSMREGFLLGLYAVGVLGLGATRLLTWWDAILLAFSLVLFEIYFISGKEKAN